MTKEKEYEERDDKKSKDRRTEGDKDNEEVIKIKKAKHRNNDKKIK